MEKRSARGTVLAALLIALLVAYTVPVAQGDAAVVGDGPTSTGTVSGTLLTRVGDTTLRDLKPASGVASPRPARPLRPGPSRTAPNLPPPRVSGAAVTTGNPGFTGFTGITAHDNQAANNGGDWNPPDQALCVGSGPAAGFVFEPINRTHAVYSSGPSHTMLTLPTSEDVFFHTTRSDGDPRCLYDAGLSRWFYTIMESDGSTFSHTLIAVSQTSDPTGAWTIFSLDSTNTGSSGCPCDADQPQIGADANGLYIEVNDYRFSTNAYLATYIYAISKNALSAAATTTSGTLPKVVTLSPSGTGAFQIQPAITRGTSFDTTNNGTEYFLSSVYVSSGTSNQIAAWALTNTGSLNTSSPAPVLTKVLLSSEVYSPPSNVPQRPGPAPWNRIGNLPALESYDVRMWETVYAAGRLWSGLTTGVTDSHGIGRDGIAYFAVTPAWSGSNFTPSMAKQGFLSVDGDNLIFPSIGVNDSGLGAIVFTLLGPDYYPSAAYAPIDAVNGAGQVHLAATGAEPGDNFDYRWGDYSAAAAAADGSIWMATEYTAGGPRYWYENWSSFVGRLQVGPGAAAATNPQGDQAGAVWGQPDLVTGACTAPSATSLCHARQSVTDDNGNLWVADYTNHRVLRFRLGRGGQSTAAVQVLGQPNFTSGQCNQGNGSGTAASARTLCGPAGLAVDKHETLYVSDYGNNRVLVFFNAASAGDDPAADLVLGQSTFASNFGDDTPAGGIAPYTCPAPNPASQCTLYAPAGLGLDSQGNLLVADLFNNRVLLWSSSTLGAFASGSCATSCFIPASRVWGQYGSFFTYRPDNTVIPAGASGRCTSITGANPASPCTLSSPSAVAADSNGNLYIADTGNNRILEYDGVLSSGRQDATMVYGQGGDFGGASSNAGGISASSLSFPTGLSFDLAGHLWAADPGNNRTLEFPVPNSAQPAISAAAVAILGQRGSATTNGFDNAGLDGGAQASPSSLSFDAADDTFISDFGNNRAIELQDPTVSISKGWNLISIPVRNNTLVTPSDVVNSLDTALGSSSAVGALSTYANGRFTLYIPKYSPNGVLQPGQGIFVLSSRGGTWTPTGTPYITGPVVALHSGWNLVAAPGPVEGLPTDLIANEIDGACAPGTCNVKAVVTYTNGAYTTYLPGGTPWQVSNKSGLWIQVASSTSWQPS